MSRPGEEMARQVATRSVVTGVDKLRAAAQRLLTLIDDGRTFDVGLAQAVDEIAAWKAPQQTALKVGASVRMSDALKEKLRANGFRAHVRQYGNCIGTVQGFADHHESGDTLDLSKIGPEVDVVWDDAKPYAYNPNELEVVE